MSSASEPAASPPAPPEGTPTKPAETDDIPISRTVRWVFGIGIVVSYGICALVFRIPAPGRFTTVQHAEEYCYELERQASGLSSTNGVYALVLTLVFIGATYLAMSVTAKSEWVRRALFATTLICAPLAFFLYRRSDAAVELAAAASEALKRSADLAEAKARGDKKAEADATTDGTSHRICVGAWGEWVKSRIDSNQIGRVALQEAAKTRDAELDKRIQKAEAAANRMQQVEGLSTQTVDAADRVEAALAKVTQALESKKGEDLSAAKTAVKEASDAVKAAPKAAPAPPAPPQIPPPNAP